MANTVYPNKIIEAKAKDLLLTAVNARSLMTIDTSLTQAAGMTKVVNTYTYSGEAEELDVGEGNTNRGSITYVPKEYTVKLVQQAFDYYDEDYYKDPGIVDMMLKAANQVMVNKMFSDFAAACATATLEHTLTAALVYDEIVDGIATLNLEDESSLFVIIPNAWKADLRKDPDYKAAQMGQVIYNGQVGEVCGLPVIGSKPLTESYVMTNEAIKLYLKADVEVEQDRDPDTRKNSVYLRTSYLVALEDATKICKLKKGA